MLERDRKKLQQIQKKVQMEKAGTQRLKAEATLTPDCGGQPGRYRTV